MFVAVERRNRNAQTSPDPVVVDAAGHHQDENLVLGDGPGWHNFKLERLIGWPVPLLADHPGVHLLGDVSERRNFANVVEILERSDAP
jgi:hypothetical protein